MSTWRVLSTRGQLLSLILVYGHSYFNSFRYLRQLTEAKCHLQPPWVGETTVHLNGSCYITRMSVMTTYTCTWYCWNLKLTHGFESDMLQLWFEYHQVCSNDDHCLTVKIILRWAIKGLMTLLLLLSFVYKCFYADRRLNSSSKPRQINT